MAKKWQQRSCSSPKAKRHIQSRHWNSGWLDLCSSLLSSLELMPKQMLYLIFMFSFSRVRSTVASQLSTSLVSSERYFHRAVQSVQNLNCHFSLPWLHKQPICPSALLKAFWPEVHGNFRLGEKNAVWLTITDTLEMWSFPQKLQPFLNLSFQLKQEEYVVLVQYPSSWLPRWHRYGHVMWASQGCGKIFAIHDGLSPGHLQQCSLGIVASMLLALLVVLLVSAQAQWSLRNRFCVLIDTHCWNKYKGWIVWS